MKWNIMQKQLSKNFSRVYTRIHKYFEICEIISILLLSILKLFSVLFRKILKDTIYNTVINKHK